MEATTGNGKCKPDKSGVVQSFFMTLTVIFSFIIVLITFYGAAVQYTSKTAPLYLALMCIELVAFVKFIPKFSTCVGKIIASCVGILVFATLLFISWKQGEWHDLYERVTCSLKLDCCLKAREWRISHDFGPIQFVGFNERFSPDDLEEHLEFCRDMTGNEAAEIAYFELRRENDVDKKVKTTYLPVSKSPSWIILANDPLPFDDKVQVDPGMLTNPSVSRVSRSPLTFPPNPTRIGIRICGEPYSPFPQDGQTIQDSDVAFWKVVSLEKIEVR